MNYEHARFNMIEQQIRPWNVLDPVVLDLLGAVRREEFVPAEARALAFSDVELPLPDGQVMLSPKLEARLLQDALVQPDDRVLEIGTGSGFFAALLAHRAREVVTLERSAVLATIARDNLARAGLSRVDVRHADGQGGLPGEAPFDAIVLSGSVARVPDALLQQLKPGGRLVAITGQLPVMRAQRFTRGAAGESITTETLFDTAAPRLVGFDEPARFRF